MQKIFLSAFLLSSILLAASPTSAQQPQPKTLPSAAVAIIDVQRILEESLASKSVQQQLEVQRAKVQAEIAGEETKLRQAEQDLVQSRNVLAPDVYADKEQQLRQRFLGVERQVQSRRKALDQAFTDSMSAVRKELLEIVKKLAAERGANLVIVKQQAFWSDKSMDLTDEALARLNKSLSKVQVKMSVEDNKNLPDAPAPSLLKKNAQ